MTGRIPRLILLPWGAAVYPAAAGSRAALPASPGITVGRQVAARRLLNARHGSNKMEEGVAMLLIRSGGLHLGLLPLRRLLLNVFERSLRPLEEACFLLVRKYFV